jgi:glycosyltransferase 2 family protein
VTNQDVDIKEVSLIKSFLSWKTLAAVIVAALIVYTFFHGYTRDDLAKLDANLHRLNPLAFGLGFASYYMAYIFLGLRYKMLLSNCGVKITLWQGVVTCFMGAASNAAMPTKVGDFYRAYLLHKHADVSVGAALGVNLGERFLDLVFVFGLFLVISRILFAHGSDVIISRLIISSSYLCGIALLVLILLLIPKTRYGVLAIFPLKARAFVTQFIDGATGSLKHNWGWLLFTTGGIWAMESTRLYMVTVALGVHMTIPEVVFTVMATTLLASIPVSFSGLGLVEGGITGLLQLFRIDAALSLATILCDRLISFVSVVIVGFFSFLFVKGAS